MGKPTTRANCGRRSGHGSLWRWSPILSILTLLWMACAAAPVPTPAADKTVPPNDQAASTAAPPPPPTLDSETLEELTLTLNHTLGRPFSFKFTPDGRTLLYLRSGARDRNAKLYALDVETKKERLVTSAQELLGNAKRQETAAEKAARERKRIKLTGLSSYALSGDGKKVLISTTGRVFLHDLESGRTYRIQLPEGELADPRLAPDGTRLAFVLDHDLYVAKLGAIARQKIRTKITRLTRGGTATQPHGLAEFVAQEEMGRYRGYWWSPDSRHLLYQATDLSALDPFTIADASAPEKPADVFPYPRAGRKNAEVRLFLVRASGRGRMEVTWKRDRWEYVAKVDWPEGQSPTVLLQSRDQRSQTYAQIDLKRGRLARADVEQDEAWLNLHDSTPSWLEDGTYLWASEKDGAWALYRRKLGKKAASKVVVPPEAGFHTLVHVDEEEGRLWFLGGTNPVELHLWRANLDGSGTPEQVTADGGLHDAVVSPDGKRVLISRSTLESLTDSRLYDVESLPVADADAGFAMPHEGTTPKVWPSIEQVAPEVAGGFHAAIIRPHGFEAGRKYPVILYVYGGPGVQVVKASAQNYLLHQWMANQGFIVVSLDGRGTPRRGRAHERALRLRFGDVPLDDQIKGLTALGKKYAELDMDRVGIYGWSYGGYLAALAALRRPDVFKVAVAGAPVVDWTYYDTHYTERYLGLPDEQPEAYRAANLLTYAQDLKVPLLLVHGIADDNVYFAHSLLLADALFKAGRKFELVPLVGLTHQVADPAVREVLYERMLKFMGDVLW